MLHTLLPKNISQNNSGKTNVFRCFPDRFVSFHSGCIYKEVCRKKQEKKRDVRTTNKYSGWCTINGEIIGNGKYLHYFTVSQCVRARVCYTPLGYLTALCFSTLFYAMDQWISIDSEPFASIIDIIFRYYCYRFCFHFNVYMFARSDDTCIPRRA